MHQVVINVGYMNLSWL